LGDFLVILIRQGTGPSKKRCKIEQKGKHSVTLYINRAEKKEEKGKTAGINVFFFLSCRGWTRKLFKHSIANYIEIELTKMIFVAKKNVPWLKKCFKCQNDSLFIDFHFRRGTSFIARACTPASLQLVFFFLSFFLFYAFFA